MTAPVTSNRPTTTRLHHYAGRHSHGSGIPVETFFAPAWGASTPVEIFFAHAHPKWLIFDHFHLAGAIFLSQRHPKLPPGATQGRSFFHTAPRDDTENPPVWRAPEGPEGLAAVPVGGGWARAGLETMRRAYQHTRHHWCGGRRRVRRAWPRCRWAVAGPGCGAGGRWRGLAAVPVGGGGAWPGFGTTAHQVPPVWRAPEGPEGTGGLRDRPLRAAGSRVAISRAAGPDGARNTSGAASNKLNR